MAMESDKPNVMQRAGGLLERLQAMQVTPAAAVVASGCEALIATDGPAVEWQTCGLAVEVVSKQETVGGLRFELRYCGCHRYRAAKGSMFARVVEVVEVQRG